MAIITNTYETYDVIGDRDDIQDLIYNIDPIDCPFMASVGRGTATNVTHEWQIDELDPAVATNKHIEGDDITSFTAQVPTLRTNNILQIARKLVIVSGTNRATSKWGRGDEMNYQTMRMGKALKRDIESQLSQDQARDTTGSDTARAADSLEMWLGPAPKRGGGSITSSRASDGADPTHSAQGIPTAAPTDGTARPFLEQYLKAVLQGCWINGGRPSLIMTGAYNKGAISAFSGNSTRYSMAQSMQLNASIDIYVSDWGTHRVVANRFSRDESCLVIDPTMWSVDYLRPFTQIELDKSGDADKRMVIAEYTLAAHNHYGSGIAADLTTTAP